MTTPLEKAVQVSLKAVRKVAGAPVTYSRGETTLTISQAVQGRTSKVNIDIGGAEQVVEAADWLIKVTDLSSLAPPEAGDLIVRTVEFVSYTWTVETLEMGEVEWDWSDTARTAYRIHTRKDGVSAYEISEPTGFDLSGAELK
jgi:hypothetical protein